MRFTLLAFFYFISLNLTIGQSPRKVFKANNSKEIQSFINNFDKSRSPSIQLKTINNGHFIGTVNLKRENDDTSLEIIGHDNNDESASFSLRADKLGNVTGNYYSTKNRVAYSFSTNKITGELVVKTEDITKLICLDYIPSNVESDEVYPLKSSRPVPVLESLPEAEAVIYLDFDGETSTSRWNNGKTIEAKSFDYSDEVIEKHWKITAEDFRPFKVNVTTNRASFDKAPKNKRILCIITPTKTAAPGAGGVAYLNSFTDGRDDPCWVFITDETKGSGEVASHEVGHTVGLNHDGDNNGAYYLGHNDWGPIMGACHRLKTVHWSRGEYPKANNQEDDYKIITTKNFGYRGDDAGNDIAGANDLEVSATGDVIAEKNGGIIEEVTDKDVFKFTASKAGKVELKINGFDHHPNLDVVARLLDKDGNEVVKYDSEDSMEGELSSDVEAGIYYIEIDGTGKGDLETGYGEYGSLGTYSISGKVPAGGEELPKALFSANKQVICSGQEVQFKDESSGTPTKWAWKFENGTPPTSDEQNPKVKYSTDGKHKVELEVTNDGGSDSKEEKEYITVSKPKALPVKEDFESDFPADGWMVDNPDEDITWEKSTKAGVDSKSCIAINNAEYKKVGEKDALMIPEVDLSKGSNDPALTFYVAYTRFDETSKDKLRVYISDNCGDSWDEVYFKESKLLETIEVDFDESQQWIPENDDDWRQEIVDIAKYKGKKSVKIKFENTNGYGNLIWMDKINIDFTSNVSTSSILENSLFLSPNPNNGTFNLSFNATEKANYSIKVRNVLGKIVYAKAISNFSGLYNNDINFSPNTKGLFFLSIENKGSVLVKKMVIE